MKEYDDALKTTINAYIRFLPRYYGELMYRGITSAPEPNNTPRSPLGQVGYRDGLVTPEIKVVVRPNNDTIYGNGYFNLKDEPVIIKVPENPENRFWSIQIADRWTNIIPGIGSRTKNKPGLYALVGPNWKGELPEGIEEERVMTEDITMVTFRVGYFSFESISDSDADLKKAAEFLRYFTVVSLSEFNKSGAVEQSPPSAKMAPPPFSPCSFTENLTAERPLALMALIVKAVKQPDCPLNAEEKELLEHFEKHLGQAMKDIEASKSDQSISAAIIEGVKQAHKLVDMRVRNAAPGNNGWVTIPAGIWDERWLDRATVAKYAIYANRPEASIYPDCCVDALMQPLDGAFKYVMRIEKDNFPPVSEFWSITIYREDSLTFAANPIDRYSIGNRTPGLKFDDDGSLTIYVQTDSPGKEKESNWLPAPKGKFNFLARYYGPEAPIKEGKYTLPALYREDTMDFLREQGKLQKGL